jgi:hypothetical protein
MLKWMYVGLLTSAVYLTLTLILCLRKARKGRKKAKSKVVLVKAERVDVEAKLTAQVLHLQNQLSTRGAVSAYLRGAPVSRAEHEITDQADLHQVIPILHELERHRSHWPRGRALQRGGRQSEEGSELANLANN